MNHNQKQCQIDGKNCKFCYTDKCSEDLIKAIKTTINDIKSRFPDDENVKHIFYQKLIDNFKEIENDLFSLKYIKSDPLKQSSEECDDLKDYNKYWLKSFNAFQFPRNMEKIIRIGNGLKFRYNNPVVQRAVQMHSEIPLTDNITNSSQSNFTSCKECFKSLDKGKSCTCELEEKSSVSKAIEQQNNLQKMLNSIQYLDQYQIDARHLFQQFGLNFEEEKQKVRMEQEKLEAMNSGILCEESCCEICKETESLCGCTISDFNSEINNQIKKIKLSTNDRDKFAAKLRLQNLEVQRTFKNLNDNSKLSEANRHRLDVAGVDFGDGSDGDFTVIQDITLEKDMFYNNLTFVNDAKIIANGYKIYVKNNYSHVERKLPIMEVASQGYRKDIERLQDKEFEEIADRAQSELKNLHGNNLNGRLVESCIQDAIKNQDKSCAVCTKCNYKNDYLGYDPDYICFKCKNF